MSSSSSPSPPPCDAAGRQQDAEQAVVRIVPPPPGAFQRIDPGPRQAVFDFYKDSDNPLWGITVRLDVTALRQACRKHKYNYLQASLFVFSKTANEYAPMRYRVRQEQDGKKYMICHDKVHPSITVMRKDGSETYGYCFWQAADKFADFAAHATAVLNDFHANSQGLDGNPRDDVMHGSVLPWLDFTGYDHAVGRVSLPSIPKYTFGKLVQDPTTGRVTQALALHVHHGCMDGLHVGRFVEKLQANLDQAETLLLL